MGPEGQTGIGSLKSNNKGSLLMGRGYHFFCALKAEILVGARRALHRLNRKSGPGFPPCLAKLPIVLDKELDTDTEK